MARTNVALVTVKGVCVDAAGRVLLCRNARGEWELPGGRPLLGEEFDACLAREIAEETGVAAVVHRIVDAFAYEVLPGRWVNVVAYACSPAEDRKPTASSEHEAVAFWPPDRIDALPIADGYRRAIAYVLRG